MCSAEQGLKHMLLGWSSCCMRALSRRQAGAWLLLGLNGQRDTSCGLRCREGQQVQDCCRLCKFFSTNMARPARS